MKTRSLESFTGQDAFLSYIAGAQTKFESLELRGLLNKDALRYRYLISGDSGVLNATALKPILTGPESLAGYFTDGTITPAIRDTCSKDAPFRSLYDKSSKARSTAELYQGTKHSDFADFLDANVTHRAIWNYDDMNDNFQERATAIMGDMQFIQSRGLGPYIETIRRKVDAKVEVEGDMLLSHFYEVADEPELSNFRQQIREIGYIVYFVNLPDTLRINPSYQRSERESINYGILHPRFNDSIEENIGSAVDSIEMELTLFKPEVFQNLSYPVIREIRETKQKDYLAAYQKYASSPTQEDWTDFLDAARVYSEEMGDIIAVAQNGKFESYVKKKEVAEIQRWITRSGGVLITAVGLPMHGVELETAILGVLFSFWGEWRGSKLDKKLRSLVSNSRQAVFAERLANHEKSS